MILTKKNQVSLDNEDAIRYTYTQTLYNNHKSSTISF